VSLRLLDLQKPGQIVWTGRFDKTTEDRLDLEEQVAGEAAAQIDSAVLNAASRQPIPDRMTEFGGYPIMLRALPLMQRIDLPSFREAGELLREAIKREPDLAPAHAWRALWRTVVASQAWSDLDGGSRDDAAALASKTVQLDPFDARGLATSGYLRAVLLRETDEARALQERALALNPNLAMAWALSAATLTFRGELTEAEARAKQYKLLAPSDPWAACLDPVIPLIALLKGDFSTASDAARSLAQISPGSRAACQIWLAALGHLGQRQLFAALLGRLNAMEPGFSLARVRAETPLARPADRELFIEGMRKAGAPDR